MHLYCLCTCVHMCVTHNVLKYACMCVCVVSSIGGLSECHLAAQEDVEAYFHDGSSAPLCPPFCGPSRPLYQSLCSPLRTSHNTQTHTGCAFVCFHLLPVRHPLCRVQECELECSKMFFLASLTTLALVCSNYSL